METKTSCCNAANSNENNEFELVKIKKTKKGCGLCENFTASKSENPDLIAVMSCEGACLRGEVSRRVANKLCFNLMPENTARVCLGGAFTKNTGQRNMVRSAKRAIALEGCAISCASRMMKGVIPDLNPEIVYVDRYYIFDTNLFGIDEVFEEELEKFSVEASSNILEVIGEKIEIQVA